MDHHARLGPGTAPIGVLVAALGDDHLAHRQLVLAGKNKIPLVVGGHAHHRSRAVLGQHVVGDPEGDQLAVGGIAHLCTDGHAALRFVVGRALLLALAAHQVTEGLHMDRLLGAGELGHQWMLRCQHHIGDAENRVGPGGEHRDRLAAVPAVGADHRKCKFGTAAATDPVGLHRAHPLWPALELGQVVEQLVGVGGDLQEPLAQLALFHQGAGAPGAPFAVDLLVGQHRLVDRVPVDGGFLLISQPSLEKLQKQPLGPAVVVAVTGRHLPAPVDREAEALQLGPHGGDVAVGPVARIHLPLDRRVLRRQAEGIPAHRMEHVAATHPLHPGDHIGDHVVAHMAHVQVPRGIGEHREGIEGLAAAGPGLRGGSGGLRLPLLLPALLDGLGLVAGALAHGRPARTASSLDRATGPVRPGSAAPQRPGG